MLAESTRAPGVLAVVALVLLGIASTAAPQGISFGGGGEKVAFAVTTDPAEARRGEAVTVLVAAAIEDGWHIYSMTPQTEEMGPQPTTIAIESDVLGSPTAFQQPKPHRKLDDAFGMIVESYEDTATFSQRWRVSESVPVGEHLITARIRFMVCDDRTCLPPTTVESTTTITVTEGPARAEFLPTAPDAPAQAGQSEAQTSLTAARSAGFFAYLAFAISMGFLALLTPCVFPMIPITVSFFAKKEGLSRAEGLKQALIYCGGIIVTFTGLGIVLALAFGAAAIQGVASNVWINLLIAGVFVVFALNLFGAFEIRVPYRLLNFLGARSGEGAGTVGTLLMGLTFSLTSFTCTVPFVGTVLVAATQGQLFWAITGMLGFSAAFASPFFILALFPQLLATLPRAGGWLNSVKVTMGFLELAAALKFLSNIDLVMGWGALPRELFLAFWVAIAVVAGVYLLGKIMLPLDTPIERLGVPRLMFGIFFLGMGFYLFTGLLGMPLGEWDAFLPPYSVGDGNAAATGAVASAESEHGAWLQDYDSALVEAGRTERPIFIDFTGVTCTNCRWMEKNIFPKPKVAALMRQFVRVQLWTDKANEDSAANREMQRQRFQTVALPFYALMTLNDEVIATFDGLTRRPEKFVEFLRKGVPDASVASVQP